MEKYKCYEKTTDDKFEEIGCTEIIKYDLSNYIYFFIFIVLMLFLMFTFSLCNKFTCIIRNKKYDDKKTQCNLYTIQQIVIHPDDSLDLLG